MTARSEDRGESDLTLEKAIEKRLELQRKIEHLRHLRDDQHKDFEEFKNFIQTHQFTDEEVVFFFPYLEPGLR
jgi:hypothetical protein